MQPASFTALLGLNGAGKSTLFSLITRLFGIQAGRIGIFGHDIGRAPGEALRLLGVVFQPRTLDLDLSVTQNLLYHAALHGIARREARLAQRRGARPASALPTAPAARCATSPAARCGGWRSRARCCIGRGCCCSTRRPSGSTSRPRSDILSHVRQLVTEQGIGVLWATHLFDEIRPSDDLVVLHQGKVLAQGEVSRVIADAGAQDVNSAFMRLTGAASPGGGAAP